MRTFQLILLVMIPTFFLSQGVRIGKYQKRWSLWHPIAALRVKQLYNKANVVYKDSALKDSLDVYVNGGTRDAFRHAFFMAVFAQRISVKKIQTLGIAHEKDNYRDFLAGKQEFGERADSLACEMDLLNNALGLSVGHEMKNATLYELRIKILQMIRKGELWIMFRNSKGQYLTCNGVVLDTNGYLHAWYVPKCIVRSNLHYKD